MNINLEVHPDQIALFVVEDTVLQEFEVRLRTDQFGVSPLFYQSITQFFDNESKKQDSFYSVVTEDYEHVLYEKRGDPKIYRVRKGKNQITTKQSIRKDDITYLGFSLRISKAIETVEKIVSIPRDYLASFCRYIERTSFIYTQRDQKKWKIDCSKVTNKPISQDGSCGKNSNTTYEIELEWFPERANVVFFDECYPVLQQLVHIIYQDVPVPRPFLCVQKTTVLSIVQTLLTEIEMNDPTKKSHQLFASLRGLVINIKEKDMDRLDREQYALTNKLDGERKFIFVYQQIVYCLNSGGPFLDGTHLDSFYVLPSKSGMNLPNCLIDCELDHGTFWMFDTLYVEGLFFPRTEKHHRDRMACIDPNWFSFPFQKKHFYYGTQEENIRSLVSTFPDATRFFHENDGFIFTYTKGSYLDTNKKHNHLKYKFSSKLSLDFLIDIPSRELLLQLQQEHPHIPYFYLLYSSERTQHGILKSMIPLRPRSIVECLWYSTTWIMLRYRDDRTSGNKDSVINDVQHDMKHPLSLEKMFPFLSTKSYLTTLSTCNQSFVIDHFYDSLLSLFFVIRPTLVLYTIRNALSIKAPPFEIDARQKWFELCRGDKIPKDQAVIVSIFSLLTNEYFWLYTVPELESIQRIYKQTFVHDLTSSIFDVRTGTLMNDSNVICKAKHHWIVPSTPKPLPPRIKHSSTEFTRFPRYITDADPEYNKFITVDASKYSSLKPWEKSQVAKLYKKWFRAPDRILHIVDATAHVGVDTIHFAQVFPQATINAFEVIEKNVEALEKNITTFGLRDRIHVHYQDVSTWMPTSHIDILYLDPPWGSSYKQKQCISLYLQAEDEVPRVDKNINYMIDQWMKTGHIDHMIVKIPSSFNKSYLFTRYKIEEVNVYQYDRSFSYSLLHIQPTIDMLYKPKSNLTLWSVPYACSHHYDMLFYNTNAVLVHVPTAPYCTIHTITVSQGHATITYDKKYVQLPIGTMIRLSGVQNHHFNQSYTVLSSTETFVTAKPLHHLVNTKVYGGMMTVDPICTSTDWISTRLYYYICQPFSYEPPHLLDRNILEAYAQQYDFIVMQEDIRIEGKPYVLFIKKELDKNQDEASMLEHMKKYHNLEKKYLIKNYAHHKSVLDLGAGFGGDLFKYEEVAVPRLILVEPNPSNLLTLKSRLDTTSSIQYHTTLVHAMGQEWDKIKPHVSERVDVVSSFFSLTFLFESITMLRAFLHTVKESIVEGGYFIGTMMSGEKTYSLLEAQARNDTITIGSDITMKKQYDNGTAQPGMKLHISIHDSIVTEQTEYLAFYSILKEELEAIGFEEVKVFDFQPPAKLKPYEIAFSQLNIGFAFRYAPTIIPYTTSLLHENDSYEFNNLYGESQVLIRTGVQRLYSFYHSFLYNTSHIYRLASSIERTIMAETLYREFNTHMGISIPPTMSISLLESFMKWKECNVYLIHVHTRCPIKYNGIDIRREYSIILSYYDTEDYEPLAIIQHDEALRLFTKINPFIAHVHRKRR